MPTPISVRPPFRTRGQNWLPLSKNLILADVTGSGGVEIGGVGSLAFVHGAQADSDIVVEWDLDNDGDFGESTEDITSYVLALQTVTGRDWPSLLTGKAGPGKLRATLRNDDDRFSYFNSASPLNAGSFSLKTGRKLRVRTTDAGNPDPVAYAKDRFGRADGALGTPEIGAAWSGPLANDFVIVSKSARPQTEGQEHIALIDVGAADYYAQMRVSNVGKDGNTVALVYRYQDPDDYSLAYLGVNASTSELASLGLTDVVGGSGGGTFLSTFESYDDVTLGVLVSGGTATMYVDGIPVLSQAAVQADETEVGIYALWGDGDTRPVIDDFYVWEGFYSQEEGILWTGDVSDLSVTVTPGPEKYAILEGEGWLSRLATTELASSRSFLGRKTGAIVGNLLARSNLLHPPFMLDEGDITTGAVALESASALEQARKLEDVEFGFLRETQEGPLAFDSRTSRVGTPVVTTLSDVGEQFCYTGIEPLDWRREVINRSRAGVSPGAPTVLGSDSFTDTAVDAVIDMDSAGLEGHIQVLSITVYHGSAAEAKWLTPPGWTEVGGFAGEDIAFAVDVFINDLKSGFSRTLVRVLDRDWVTGDSFQFTEGLTTDDSYSAVLYTISDWFGSIGDGVAASDRTAVSAMDVPNDDPPAVFPTWGPAPSVFLAFCAGILGSAGFSGSAPLGYRAYGKAGGVGVFESFTESAYRRDAVSVENPGSFNHDYGGDDGWVEQAVVIAIRGYNSGINNGVLTVELNDLDSQDDHNSIRTNTDVPELFATEADAETYAQLLLDTYAGDRPLIRVQFAATKSGAYRALAVRSRVNDRITLVATGNSGLGISGDFFIENIEHTWSNGRTMWQTAWQLSPA